PLLLHGTSLRAIYSLSLQRRSSDLFFLIIIFIFLVRANHNYLTVSPLEYRGVSIFSFYFYINFRGICLRTCGQKSKNKSKCYNRSEEHTSELQSRENLVCRLMLEKK